MNCQYCHNKIFEKDRFCPSCGAPNYFIEEDVETSSYGAFINMLEQTEIPSLYSEKQYFKKYIQEPMRKFIIGCEIT